MPGLYVPSGHGAPDEKSRQGTMMMMMMMEMMMSFGNLVEKVGVFLGKRGE